MSVSTYDTENISAWPYDETLSDIEIWDSHRFFSEGSNGTFELRTFITRVRDDPRQELFNVGFGVWDNTRQIVDDKIQTRNEDMPIVLGTIAAIALDFLRRHPYAYLYAEGSTLVRTRLYQREISKVFDELPRELELYGLIKKDDVGFVKFHGGTNFDGFLLSRSNR